jgi:ribosomal protein S3
MLVFFQQTLTSLKVKGLKIRLKGKISAAGNSRKRSILYRVGQTSHSEFNIRILHESEKVITFTGVMGLFISIFY